jgi:hypothetical protein
MKTSRSSLSQNPAKEAVQNEEKVKILQSNEMREQTNKPSQKANASQTSLIVSHHAKETHKKRGIAREKEKEGEA